MTMSNKKVMRGEVPHNENIEKNHQDKKKEWEEMIGFILIYDEHKIQ